MKTITQCTFYFRIKAFQDVLEQDVIDIVQLQRLAFNGNDFSN